MADYSLPLLLLGFATFFLAGLVKGVTGMGLPTVAMGVLGALVSPLAAATLLIVPSMVTNGWQLLSGPSLGGLIKRFWPMMLAICSGTIPGAVWIAQGGTAATTALGAALVLYAGYTLLAPPMRISDRIESWLSPTVGATTGLVTGATGIFVIPAVPYLQALGLAKDDLVQALGLSFTVSTIALALALGLHGSLQSSQIGLSLLAVVPALLGMWVGQVLRRRISAALFRRVFLCGLLLLGLEMMLRLV